MGTINKFFSLWETFSRTEHQSREAMYSQVEIESCSYNYSQQNCQKPSFFGDEYHTPSQTSESTKHWTWSDASIQRHVIYDKDDELDTYQRKAPKLSYKSLHPGNNKQDVNRVIAIFHESTNAVSQYYFPGRPDMANFMKVIWTWWTIAILLEVGWLARVLDMFKFLSKQTDIKGPGAYAKIPSYDDNKIFCRKDTCLCWLKGCKVIRLEGEFSQYRQMSGGRFLVSLCEVRNTERILACRSLLKDDVDLWQGDLVTENEDVENFMSILEEHETDIYEVCLSDSSEEVTRLIAR